MKHLPCDYSKAVKKFLLPYTFIFKKGKTYTLYGALDYISRRFQQLDDIKVLVTFYEVHGSKCYDLLTHRKLVHLRFDAQERPHVRGARHVVVTSGQSLMDVLQEGIALRSSLVTERNPISSRSHAVCTLELVRARAAPSPGTVQSLAQYLQRHDGDGDMACPVDDLSRGETHHHHHHPTDTTAAGGGGGRITLVDLAGSERNYETTHMTAAQHKESADINLALMSLKNCFRAYHSNLSASEPLRSRVPYRDSTLTKVLKECFYHENIHHGVTRRHFTTIMATISPTPVDIQHSINTINHVLLMSRELEQYTDYVTVEVPKSSLAALSTTPIVHWTPLQVQAWLANIERGRFAHIVLPPGLDGRGLLELSLTNLSQLFEEAERTGRRDQEGPTWVISVEENSRIQNISLALYNAVRREQAMPINSPSTMIPI